MSELHKELDARDVERVARAACRKLGFSPDQKVRNHNYIPNVESYTGLGLQMTSDFEYWPMWQAIFLVVHATMRELQERPIGWSSEPAEPAEPVEEYFEVPNLVGENFEIPGAPETENQWRDRMGLR